MINIVALRESEGGRKYHVNFSKNYGVAYRNIEDLLQNRSLIVDKLRDNSQDYNVYFTVAENLPGETREFKAQWVVPFDIDGLEFPSDKEDDLIRYATEVVDVSCRFLGVDFDKVASVFSGNGVQFFVKNFEPITYPEFFQEYKESYDEKCRTLERHLNNLKYKCHLDTTVFSINRIMRLPDTYNIKPDKPKRMAVLLNQKLEAQELGLVRSEPRTFKTGELLVKYPDPDSDYVEEQCLFLVNNKKNPNEVLEPQWYADIGVRAFLQDGPNRVHEASKGYHRYDPDETDRKIEQALANAGPRTCKSISGVSKDCLACPHNGKVVSPITLRGPNYLSSKNHGFREQRLKNNEVIPGPPHYDDLIKLFSTEFLFKVEEKSQEIYTWQKTHWVTIPDSFVSSWAIKKVHSPSLKVSEAIELIGRLKMHNVVNIDFFERKKGFINFSNGTYSVPDMKLYDHSPDFGMTYTLKHAYDPEAQCPLYDKFLETIFEPDQIEAVNQYLGYCISGSDNWLHKCLFMIGSGSNGKSTLVDTIIEIVGDRNVSSVSLQKLGMDTYRQRLHHRLFNFSEETSIDSIMDSSDFKNLVSGGRMVVKELYKQPVEVRNSCKFITSCNEMPIVTDLSYGIRRRFFIVEMRKTFKGSEKVVNYHKKLVAEASGIFNRLISAYARLLERGDLPELESSERAIEEMTEASNPIVIFYKDHLEFIDGGICRSNEVYDAYTIFCAKNGIRYPLNSNVLQRKIKDYALSKGVSLGKGKDSKGRYTTNMIIKNFKGSEL